MKQKIFPQYLMEHFDNKSLPRSSRRHIAVQRATPKFTNHFVVAKIYDDARRANRHVDHIVPLIHPMVCGLHYELNLQILDPAANMKKSNRYWPDMWLEQLELF